MSLIHQTGTTYHVVCDVTFDSVVALRREGDRCIAASNSALCFDFQQVQQTKSIGLSLLLAWIRGARRYQRKIMFAHLPQQWIDVARLCGVWDCLAKYTQENEGVNT